MPKTWMWILSMVFFIAVELQATHQRLLYIDSYHAEFPWSQRILNGIESALADHPEVELYIEHMDTKRYTSPKQIADIERLLASKLEGERFDGVLVSDDNAYRFALRKAATLFADIPVVFCGVNAFDPEAIADKPLFTGLAEIISPKETLQTALALQPALKRFVVIGSTETFSEKINLRLIRQTESFFPSLEYHYLTDLNDEELKAKIRNIKQGSAILLTGIIKNRVGRKLSFVERTAFVRKYSNVPLYSFWDHNLGNGIVGGYLVSARGHGYNAARIMLEILSGAPPRAVDLSAYPANRYLFDYNELKRFNLSPARLPAGSQMINSPQGMLEWARENILLVLVLVVSVIAVALLFVLLMQIRSKRKIGAIAKKLRLEIVERQKIEAELESVNSNLKNRVESELQKRRRQEQMLIQQSKMAAMGEMIGAIAHQWKQPLNVIGLIAQELGDAHAYGELDEAGIKEIEAKIMQQIIFMSQTVDDFRNFL